MYTQCKIQFEPFDGPKIIDTVWIPTKFSKVGQYIVIDKPSKRRAKVLEVYTSREKVERRTWNNNI